MHSCFPINTADRSVFQNLMTLHQFKAVFHPSSLVLCRQVPLPAWWQTGSCVHLESVRQLFDSWLSHTEDFKNWNQQLFCKAFWLYEKQHACKPLSATPIACGSTVPVRVERGLESSTRPFIQHCLSYDSAFPDIFVYFSYLSSFEDERSG